MARVRVRRAVSLLVGLLVAGLFGLAYISYQREIRHARERVSTGSHIVQTPCGPIEYARAGNGPPVLVVHGAGGGYDQGLEFGEPLVHRGFRIIAMSRFGYLRTPLPPDASASAQADAHACLLDALEIRRAAVVGASAGAPSAMQLALRHPDWCRALVLLVPAAYVPRPGGAPPMQTPAGTEFLFETALKSDFLFWAATRLARSTVIRAILATPPAVVVDASADEQARGGHYARPPVFESGGGGLVSTVDDLLAFGRMLLHNGAYGHERILSRPSVELMTTDHITPEQKAASPFFEHFWTDHGWGLGVGVCTARRDLAGVPGRFGWDGAFGTSWWVDPKEQLVGVFLTQRRPDVLSMPAFVLDFWTSAYQLIDD